jgi:3-methylcrotonyl-CoA carboxylase alpha subunit
MNSATEAQIETPLGMVKAEHQAGRWSLNGQPAGATLKVAQSVHVFGPSGASFTIVDPLDRAGDIGGETDVIVAPMPGLVKSVFVKSGQTVLLGDRIAVLEAMKMEHSLLAQRSGVVAEVLAEEGSQVEAGAALVQLEAEEEAAT